MCSASTSLLLPGDSSLKRSQECPYLFFSFPWLSANIFPRTNLGPRAVLFQRWSLLYQQLLLELLGSTLPGKGWDVSKLFALGFQKSELMYSAVSEGSVTCWLLSVFNLQKVFCNVDRVSQVLGGYERAPRSAPVPLVCLRHIPWHLSYYYYFFYLAIIFTVWLGNELGLNLLIFDFKGLTSSWYLFFF
jgi:hypothetical protein